VTAVSGELFQESQGEERYLSLTDGFRVEGKLGEDSFRLMRFKRNDIRVPDSEKSESGRTEERYTTAQLIASGTAADRAEVHWRLGAPIAAMVLALLAVPLSRSPPRSARYGRILFAVLAYIQYVILLSLGRAWIAEGAVPAAFGLWWVHLPALAAALWLMWRDERLPRPRQAA
jgi:lipopolysaccharide export system permease protein